MSEQIKITRNYIRDFILFLLFVFSLEIAHFFLKSHFYNIVNDQFVFGLIGNNILAMVVSLLIIILVLFLYLLKYASFLPTMLIAGGAIVNIVDRGLFHGVVDYIFIPLIPTFNLSDCFIVFGFILILLNLIFLREN